MPSYGKQVKTIIYVLVHLDDMRMGGTALSWHKPQILRAEYMCRTAELLDALW